MAVGYASGKVILFGEHAVVYGRPAIAVPITQVQARAEVEDAERGQGITIVARDLGHTHSLSEAPPDDALRTIVVSTLERTRVGLEQDLTITVSSTIPIARGLGSGAAVSTAIVRALLEHFDKWLDSRAISDLVFETEKIHHGTPSGIDNTVIAFEKPVYFVKGGRMEIFWVQRPFLLVIADTGVQSPTKVAVGDVRTLRRHWHHRRDGPAGHRAGGHRGHGSLDEREPASAAAAQGLLAGVGGADRSGAAGWGLGGQALRGWPGGQHDRSGHSGGVQPGEHDAAVGRSAGCDCDGGELRG
jgi:mevalonate kinase